MKMSKLKDPRVCSANIIGRSNVSIRAKYMYSRYINVEEDVLYSVDELVF